MSTRATRFLPRLYRSSKMIPTSPLGPGTTTTILRLTARTFHSCSRASSPSSQAGSARPFRRVTPSNKRIRSCCGAATGDNWASRSVTRSWSPMEIPKMTPITFGRPACHRWHRHSARRRVLSVIADHTSMGTGGRLPTSFCPQQSSRAATATRPLTARSFFVRLRQGAGANAGSREPTKDPAAADRDSAAAPNRAVRPTRGRWQLCGARPKARIFGPRARPSLTRFRGSRRVPSSLSASPWGVGAAAENDLAVPKTLGFMHRQLAAALAWQASVAALVGIVVGVPLG